MNKDELILTTFLYVVAFFSFYKYRTIKRKIHVLEPITIKCTDIIVRRTYNKKYYMYFYKKVINNEEYSICDKKRLPLMQSKIQIGKKYNAYIDKKNANNYVSPIEVLTYKFYFLFAILLIILPLLFFR